MAPFLIRTDDPDWPPRRFVLLAHGRDVRFVLKRDAGAKGLEYHCANARIVIGHTELRAWFKESAQ